MARADFVKPNMKDPIVDEVRRHRMEHTQQFHADLALICEDFRKLEAALGDRLVNPQPRRLHPTQESAGDASRRS